MKKKSLSSSETHSTFLETRRLEYATKYGIYSKEKDCHEIRDIQQEKDIYKSLLYIPSRLEYATKSFGYTAKTYKCVLYKEHSKDL